MGRWRAAPEGLGDGQLAFHAGGFVPRLVAEERVLARGHAQSRGVVLELGHRHLVRPGRLTPAATTARGENGDRGQRYSNRFHLNAVTPRYRIPKRNIQTTSTKCQYRVTAAGPT